MRSRSIRSFPSYVCATGIPAHPATCKTPPGEATITRSRRLPGGRAPAPISIAAGRHLWPQVSSLRSPPSAVAVPNSAPPPADGTRAPTEARDIPMTPFTRKPSLPRSLSVASSRRWQRTTTPPPHGDLRATDGSRPNRVRLTVPEAHHAAQLIPMLRHFPLAPGAPNPAFRWFTSCWLTVRIVQPRRTE